VLAFEWASNRLLAYGGVSLYECEWRTAGCGWEEPAWEKTVLNMLAADPHSPLWQIRLVGQFVPGHCCQLLLPQRRRKWPF